MFFYSDNGGATSKNASRNDPLRGQKGLMFEGGIRVPFVMQWEGQIPAGLTYTHPVMGFDCHATALAAAGVKVEGMPIDGVDLLPYVTGKNNGKPHKSLFWRAGNKHAARVGDWKLVTEPRLGTALFNLKQDIGETNDVSKSRPEKFKQLKEAYAAWDSQMIEPLWIRQDRRNAEPGGKLKPGFAFPGKQ